MKTRQKQLKKSSLRALLKEQQGAVLVVSLVVLSMLTGIGAVNLQSIVSQQKGMLNQRSASDALTIAESTVLEGMAALEGGDYNTDQKVTVLDGSQGGANAGAVSVYTISAVEGRTDADKNQVYSIVTEATINGITRSIEAFVTKSSLKIGLVGCDEVVLDQNVDVTGNVQSTNDDADVSLASNTTVNGDVIAGGEIDVHQNAVITGAQIDGVTDVCDPQSPEDYINPHLDNDDANNFVNSGGQDFPSSGNNITINPAIGEGYRVYEKIDEDGDREITFSDNVKVKISEDVDLDEEVVWNLGDNVEILINDDLTLRDEVVINVSGNAVIKIRNDDDIDDSGSDAFPLKLKPQGNDRPQINFTNDEARLTIFAVGHFDIDGVDLNQGENAVSEQLMIYVVHPDKLVECSSGKDESCSSRGENGKDEDDDEDKGDKGKDEAYKKPSNKNDSGDDKSKDEDDKDEQDRWGTLSGFEFADVSLWALAGKDDDKKDKDDDKKDKDDDDNKKDEGQGNGANSICTGNASNNEVIDFASNTSFTGILYAPSYDVCVSSNVNIKGSIRGKRVEMSSNSQLTVDAKSDGIAIISWRELN